MQRQERYGVERAGEHMQHTWGELMQSIRTGESSFETKFGMPIFDYLAANPMVGAMFDSAMTGFHGLDIADLVDAYDFSECQLLADIGGGNASMLIAALERLRGSVGEPHLPDQMAAFGISGQVGGGLRRLFMSHPPLEERIAALRAAG